MDYEYELYHHGVKGMKWGVRKKRAVADGLVRRAVVGAGVPTSYGGGTKHQLSRAKKDLDILDNGGHLSIGITKKRQAAFDARDRANLEKKISNLINHELELIGVTSKLKGRQYIHDVILYLIQNENGDMSPIQYLTKIQSEI